MPPRSDGLDSLPRGVLQKRILDRLQKSDGRIVTRQQLAQAAWGDDPTGGPDYADNIIRVTIHGLRRMGFPIGTTVGYVFNHKSTSHKRAYRKIND